MTQQKLSPKTYFPSVIHFHGTSVFLVVNYTIEWVYKLYMFQGILDGVQRDNTSAMAAPKICGKKFFDAHSLLLNFFFQHPLSKPRKKLMPPTFDSPPPSAINNDRSLILWHESCCFRVLNVSIRWKKTVKCRMSKIPHSWDLHILDSDNQRACWVAIRHRPKQRRAFANTIVPCVCAIW